MCTADWVGPLSVSMIHPLQRSQQWINVHSLSGNLTHMLMSGLHARKQRMLKAEALSLACFPQALSSQESADPLHYCSLEARLTSPQLAPFLLLELLLKSWAALWHFNNNRLLQVWQIVICRSFRLELQAHQLILTEEIAHWVCQIEVSSIPWTCKRLSCNVCNNMVWMSISYSLMNRAQLQSQIPACQTMHPWPHATHA